MKEMVVKMDRFLFKTKEDALIKLKELNILTKTKKVEDLDNFLYYTKDKDGKQIVKSCKVIGYNYKDNPKDCISAFYENLIIEVEGEEIHINIDYFKDMQSKGFFL